MKNFLKYIRCVALLFGITYCASVCRAESASPNQPLTWALPYEVTDQNTEIRFEVDSTWHLVKGKVTGVSGRVWLAHAGEPRSIRSDISIPVGTFNTDNSSRDERMREVMAVSTYPSVTLTLNGLNGTCEPKLLQKEQPCTCSLPATLGIRDVKKAIELPCTLRIISETQAELNGSYAFSWADFHVEDPSIFIARLNPSVTVFYSTKIPLVDGAAK